MKTIEQEVGKLEKALSHRAGISQFQKMIWNKLAGLEGAFTALSNDGQTEAIAEPVTLRSGELVGWRLWLVNVRDRETLWMEDVCL